MADIFRVQKTNNYTVMSNHHFKDQRLSLRAKGLLSLILSLPNDWDLTLKGLVKICTEGRDAIANTIKELASYGYIRKTQPRSEIGTLQKVLYEIYEEPLYSPLTENTEVVEKHENPGFSPLPENPLPDNPAAAEPFTVNPTQLSTKKIKYEKNKDTHQSVRQDSDTAELCSPEDIVQKIKDNLEYDILCERYDKNQIDAIVSLLCDTLSCLEPSIKIGGKHYTAWQVKDRFLALEFEHIEFVLDYFIAQAAMQKIKNVHAYMLTILFNAASSMELHYTTLIEQAATTKTHSKQKTSKSLNAFDLRGGQHGA
jgi:hypothetical protein